MIVDILVFLAVLSLLVFVHEMGHFLAAKTFGIYCDRFSLGLPPRIWGFKWGETDYCIGALPFGGFVKMAGQEDSPLSEEEREATYGHVPEDRFFTSKPVWQRFIVVASGPFMNLLLAIPLYMIMAGVGGEVQQAQIENRVGEIMDGSPVLSAKMYLVDEKTGKADFDGPPDAVGWKTGDRITELNGRPVESILQDVMMDAALSAGKPLTIHLERTGSRGNRYEYVSVVAPKIIPNSGMNHPRLGIYPYDPALIEAFPKESPARDAGLRTGDIVLTMDGTLVDKPVLAKMIREDVAGQNPVLEIKRDGETVAIRTQTKQIGGVDGLYLKNEAELDDESILDGPAIVAGVSPELAEHTAKARQKAYLAENPDTPENQVAQLSGLKPNDHITAINGQPVTLREAIDYKRTHPGETMDLTVERPSIWFGLLRKASTFKTSVPIEKRGMIGVVFGDAMVYQREPISQIIPATYKRIEADVRHTVVTLKQLITRDISPKELGGPLTIGRVVSAARKAGFFWLIQIVAFISINLFIFNLLPFPVLDGGLLLFLILEGIRRKPLNEKVLEWIQRGGVAFLLLLILAVTFNDVKRWIASLLT